jgi:hypothetical protein
MKGYIRLLHPYFTRTDSTGTSNFLSDALGSTIALADSTGTVQTQYTAVQLPEIAKRALSRAIRGTHRLDQRPVAVFLAVLANAKLSQKHASNLSLLWSSGKGVGFHYTHFSTTSH